MAPPELRSRKQQQDGKAAAPAAASTATDSVATAAVKGAEKATAPAPAPAGNVGSKGKFLKVMVLASLVCGPAVALFLVMDISFQQRRSIVINFIMSVLAFGATRYLIPVAIPYVLKRNMFGMDINKRGSPGGEIKMSGHAQQPSSSQASGSLLSRWIPLRAGQDGQLACCQCNEH